ncbi:MAG: Ldh family oxidoreductase, partial [Rhodospirillales bacterium]
MPSEKSQSASVSALDRFCRQILRAIDTDDASTEAATRAMMHGSIHGVDSHGIRLLAHYVKAFEGGRLNKNPILKIRQVRSGTLVLEADNA